MVIIECSVLIYFIALFDAMTLAIGTNWNKLFIQIGTGELNCQCKRKPKSVNPETISQLS